MIDLREYSFIASEGNIVCGRNEIKFYTEGKPLESRMYEFSMKTQFLMEEYIVLEYHCQGIRRPKLVRAPFLVAEMEEQEGKEVEVPLVCFDDIMMDNHIHSVIVKAPQQNCMGIYFKFGADRRKKAEFTIHKLYTCKREELPVACERQNTFSEKYAYETIELENFYNGDYCVTECMIDGGRYFETGEISLCKIPFKIGTGTKKVIMPPPPPEENEETILNFGVLAKRRLCRPMSRSSLIEIPLHRPVKELFFVMTISGKRYQRFGFATDGTILGSPNGEVTLPLSVRDTEGFMVELVYENGNRDTAFPLNLSLGYHIVEGDVGIYGVPADGSQVAKVIFHNRLLDSDCSIAAVTINAEQKRQFPQMLIPEKTEEIYRECPVEKKLELKDDVLWMQNGALTMKVGLSGGFRLLEMSNIYTPQCTLAQDSLLKLKDEQGNITDEFDLVGADICGDSAEITYHFKGQEEFVIKVFFSDENDIGFQLRAKNISKETTQTAICFPCLTGLVFEDMADTWYFFPKLQNIDSNETVFIYEESAPSFPMQFMDVYSPAQQGGLSLTTRERELVVRKYGLEKDEGGVSFYVEYPYMYGELKPGELLECSPTLFTSHDGDWRRSYDIYKKWLDSWYEPYKCQDKQWYRECFWLIAEIRDFFETREFTRLPIWYDREKKEFQFMRVLEEQKEITGHYPDILHLWAWTYREENGCMQWGNFGTVDYDLYDGMENFRNALWQVKNEKGINVSLYLHPTLLSARYPQAKKFFPKYKVINDQGNHISIRDHTYRMCHAAEEWRDHAVSMYPRIYEELKIPLLYVDEFSLRVENRCYGEGHGHEVPSNLLKTDRNFITQLKEAMPEEVVLYGEYTAVDVNARYIDCNITYYIIDAVMDMIETAWRGRDGDDRLSPVITDMYRFAFPKIVQLVLPMAMRNLSWHPQKFIFFNGEAIYDSFWDCEESRGHKFTVRAYELKKKYADCFSSDNPTSMVDTLTPAVCANRFPGKGRTVYTLYNRAYSTYRGKVLRISHEEGMKYFDAWNGIQLEPEFRNGFAEISLTIDALQIGCLEISCLRDEGERYYEKREKL